MSFLCKAAVGFGVSCFLNSKSKDIFGDGAYKNSFLRKKVSAYDYTTQTYEIKPYNYNWDNQPKIEPKTIQYLVFVASPDDNSSNGLKGGSEALSKIAQSINELKPRKWVSSEMGEAVAQSIINSIDGAPDIQVQVDIDLTGGIPIAPDPINPRIKDVPTARDMEMNKVRLNKAFTKLIKRNEEQQPGAEVFVCDPVVISYFACKLIQVPVSNWARFKVEPGTLSMFIVEPKGEVRLVFLGDSSHLQ